jgi:hypothetical protein
VIAGRVSAFADHEIIKLASESFVPCTADDWYQRRRQDDEGKFFVAVANQGPRKGEGGNTRQGIYCLTADGELLTFKNAGQSVEATKEQLQQALKKFRALPENRRAPGAMTVPAHGTKDPNYSRTSPEGGLIVRVHGRILEKSGDSFSKGNCDFKGGDRASRDFLWLTAKEVAAMAPGDRAVGTTYELPKPVVERIARFHLIDNTRGEPDFWKKTDLHETKMTLTVAKVTDTGVTLNFSGKVLIADNPAPTVAKRGYECELTGVLVFDTTKQTITAFDVVAIGEHWGCSTFTKIGMRPGKTQYGVALGLPESDAPKNRVAPQAAREANAYFGK